METSPTEEGGSSGQDMCARSPSTGPFQSQPLPAGSSPFPVRLGRPQHREVTHHTASQRLESGHRLARSLAKLATSTETCEVLLLQQSPNAEALPQKVY